MSDELKAIQGDDSTNASANLDGQKPATQDTAPDENARLIEKLKTENAERRIENKQIRAQLQQALDQMGKIKSAFGIDDQANQNQKTAQPSGTAQAANTNDSATAKIQSLILRNELIARGAINQRAAQILADAAIREGVVVDVETEKITGIDAVLESIKPEFEFCFSPKSDGAQKTKTPEPLGRPTPGAANAGSGGYPAAMLKMKLEQQYPGTDQEYYERVWVKLYPTKDKKT